MNTEEKTRYSDEELQEFRQIILEKLAKARKNLEMLREEAFTGNSNGTSDTDPSPLPEVLMGEADGLDSKESNARMAARQQKFIKDLENALARIANKTYGICRVTGKLIPKERLRAVPHATLSIEAKNAQNNKR